MAPHSVYATPTANVHSTFPKNRKTHRTFLLFFHCHVPHVHVFTTNRNLNKKRTNIKCGNGNTLELVYEHSVFLSVRIRSTPVHTQSNILVVYFSDGSRLHPPRRLYTRVLMHPRTRMYYHLFLVYYASIYWHLNTTTTCAMHAAHSGGLFMFESAMCRCGFSSICCCEFSSTITLYCT